MEFVQSFVFLDLETTGMPVEESNKTKITEISLIAVKRSHILDTRIGVSPRVQQKLTLCLNPGKLIQPSCSEVTGLCNDLLEHEPFFDKDIFMMINKFLSKLIKPVCLVAQNGMNFDFPILKNQLAKVGECFAEDLLCADCFHGFYDILNEKSHITVQKPTNDLSHTLHLTHDGKEIIETYPKQTQDIQLENEIDIIKDIQLKNELTPTKKITVSNRCQRKLCNAIRNPNVSTARRKFPWSQGSKPKEKYKLNEIYKRVLNRPSLEAHRAENDCLMALEISVALQREFVEWVDSNCCLFSEIKPMRVGIPLGE